MAVFETTFSRYETARGPAINQSIDQWTRRFWPPDACDGPSIEESWTKVTGWRAREQTGRGERGDAPTPWSAKSKARPSEETMMKSSHPIPPLSGSPRARRELQDRDVQVPAPRQRVDLTQHAVPFQHIKLPAIGAVVSGLSPQTRC
jgi:hypothetical protein